MKIEDEVLRFDSVDICYGSRRVVTGVEFSLYKGEILGIVGESGSGKSTLIKAAMGLLGEQGLVTRGDIYYQGKNIPDLPERALREIRGSQMGMIFQDAEESLCPIRTIGDQIYESMRAHQRITRAEAQTQALELLEKLEFPDAQRIWNSYPLELSGGMNQRVGIALAMIMKPAILMADEPTSALDVSVQRQVLQEIAQVREMFETSVLLVTHDIGVVSALADRILVLKDGTIMEIGETAEILNAPKNAYTRQLLDAVPRLRR